MANSDTRTKSQIEADINSARVRLAANLEGLIDEVHPQAIKKRKMDELKADLDKAKGFVADSANDAKAQFVNEDGSPRTDRIVLVAGIAAGVVAIAVGAKLIANRAEKN